MDDIAAVRAQVAQRMQAAREVFRLVQVLERDRAHARHDAHVEHDVFAVGDLDSDLGEAGSRSTHQKGHDIHGAPLHGALK